MHFKVFYLLALITITTAQANQTKQGKYRYILEQEEKYVEDSRNIFYSCIVVTQNFLSTVEGIEAQLHEIVAPFSDVPAEEKRSTQLAIWKRIFIDGIKICADKQTPLGAQQMYADIQRTDFSFGDHYDLLEGFTLEKYLNRQVNLEFDEGEKTIWSLVSEFQNKMQKNRQRQQQALDDDDEDEDDLVRQIEEYQRNSQHDSQLFGQSLRGSNQFSIVIVLVVFALFFGGMILAYRALSSEPESPKKKTKKEKKL